MSDEIKIKTDKFPEMGRNFPVSWEVIYAICKWKPKKKRVVK